MTAERGDWTVLRCVLAAFALLGCALVQNIVLAAEAQIKKIEPLISEGHLTMDLDVGLKLSSIVLEAAERGVPLYFTLDVKIKAPRWWWLDKSIIDTSLTRRMSYNTLTQQWRVATGDLYLPVASLQEALAVMEKVRGWPVAPLDRFEPNIRYEGAVRIRLDTTHLARPLQLDARNRGAWSLTSPWKPFDFSVRKAGATP
ncbi:MAG: DUF4390 domain-containing protein [Burkholderiaceae bacterium]|jgi:hypothetical protein|nr:DUF4390 domain-containing protein [Burkholderiaceae bacterium]